MLWPVILFGNRQSYVNQLNLCRLAMLTNLTIVTHLAGKQLQKVHVCTPRSSEMSHVKVHK